MLFSGVMTALRLVLVTKNISSNCLFHLSSYLDIIDELNFVGENMWAWKMLDATAKIPEGMLYGVRAAVGNYDECLDIVHPRGEFRGKHCTLHAESEIFDEIITVMLKSQSFTKFLKGERIPLRGGFKPAYGICIPSTCTTHDILTILDNEQIKKLGNVTVADDNCSTNEHRPFSDGSRAFIWLGILLVFLAIFSTMYETYALFGGRKAKKPNPILGSFSLYSNTKEMIKIQKYTGDHQDMSFLHGIRTLSMMWVVLCHTYNTILRKSMLNPTPIAKAMTNADHTIIINGFYSVDSFFFLSGMLVAFVFFRSIDKNGHFDAPVSIIHRYLRLTPAYLVVLLFNMTLMSEISNGPYYLERTLQIKTACENYLWSNLLYIENYINPLTPCIGQSWYLSADMQMFWISPLILYPLYFWPKLGAVCLALLTIASTLWTFTRAYVNKYRGSLVLKFDTRKQFADENVATFARMTPWLVGILLGFAICAISARKLNIRLSKTKVLLGWTFSTVVCLSCLFGVRRFIEYPDASDAEHAMYLSFSRLGWSLGLAWIVFACIYGYGGLVTSFLSLGIFQPLGKLSYSVYLIHYTIITYKVVILRNNFYATDFNLICDFLGVLVMSHFFGIALYLLVELPVVNLTKKFLSSVKIYPYPVKRQVKNSKGKL